MKSVHAEEKMFDEQKKKRSPAFCTAGKFWGDIRLLHAGCRVLPYNENDFLSIYRGYRIRFYCTSEILGFFLTSVRHK